MSSPEYPGDEAGLADALAWVRTRRATVPADVVPTASTTDWSAVILDGGTEHVHHEIVSTADGIEPAGIIVHRTPLSE